MIVDEGVAVNGIVGVSVEVGIFVAVAKGIIVGCKDCTACTGGFAGAHPAKTDARIKKQDNQDNDLIVVFFPILMGAKNLSMN